MRSSPKLQTEQGTLESWVNIKRACLQRFYLQCFTACQEAALSGFLSGWRAALGIRDELDALPRFSLIDEDEARMREEE